MKSPANRTRSRHTAPALFLASALALAAGGCDEEKKAPDSSASAETASAGDWCAGHGLPESKCTKCNPELTSKFKEAGDWCAEHGFPESACPECNPMEPPPGAAKAAPFEAGTRIRFREGEIERASGIATAEAQEAALDIGVECTARLDFDQNHVADIRAPVPGVVREVQADLGQEVEAGTRLFVLESPRVGDLQGKLRAARQRVKVARANHDRQESLRASEIASARKLELARQELESAKSELRALQSSLRIAGASGRSQAGRYALRSPLAGQVVRRPATVGTFATEETSLATVADTSVMWALLEIREADAAAVRLGQKVSLRVDGIEDRTFSGELTWIAAEVDPRTRTVDARAEVENPDGLLRAQQFARATVQVSAPDSAVAIPRDAVQRLGEDRVVFVRTGDGLYEPRAVELGRTNGELAQIIGDVPVGASVVTDGAFLLKTELTKESIGAGCCEVESPGGD